MSLDDAQNFLNEQQQINERFANASIDYCFAISLIEYLERLL